MKEFPLLFLRWRDGRAQGWEPGRSAPASSAPCWAEGGAKRRAGWRGASATLALESVLPPFPGSQLASRPRDPQRHGGEPPGHAPPSDSLHLLILPTSGQAAGGVQVSASTASRAAKGRCHHTSPSRDGLLPYQQAHKGPGVQRTAQCST